jgi:hypothetical protein
MQNPSNSLPSTSQDVQMAVSDPVSSKVEVVRSKYVTSVIICSLQVSEMSDEEDFEEIKDVKRHSQPMVTQASGAAHLSFFMMLYVWFACRPVPVLLCSAAPLQPYPLLPLLFLLFRFQSLFVQLRVSSWSSPRLLVRDAELAQLLRQNELICVMKLTPKAMTR